MSVLCSSPAIIVDVASVGVVPVEVPSTRVGTTVHTTFAPVRSIPRPTRSRRVVAAPTTRAANKLGVDINNKIIALRLKKRMSFAEIAREVGCDETYARRVINTTADGVFVFSTGNAS